MSTEFSVYTRCGGGQETGVAERRRFRRNVIVLAAIVIGLALPATFPAATFHCTGGDVARLISAMNTANGNGQSNTI
jgi:hypothetical protein